MPNITENTRRFIENSNIDYFTYFIKTWIPFNLWYNTYYPTLFTEEPTNITVSNFLYKSLGLSAVNIMSSFLAMLYELKEAYNVYVSTKWSSVVGIIEARRAMRFYLMGKTVKVYYIPKDPYKSALKTGTNSIWFRVTIPVLFSYRYYCVYKNKKRSCNRLKKSVTFRLH